MPQTIPKAIKQRPGIAFDIAPPAPPPSVWKTRIKIPKPINNAATNKLIKNDFMKIYKT